MSRIGAPGGTSAYFRLSTRPIDPSQAGHPGDPQLLERRRRHAIAGGYRITSRDQGAEVVTLVGVGAVMPEVIAAAQTLSHHGLLAGVVCLTSPDLIFRSMQRRHQVGPSGVDDDATDIAAVLFPATAPTPLVTVHDGHPHALSFLAALRGDPVRCLGVTQFGQSSSLPDAYQLHGIDQAAIVDAALTLG